MSLNASIQANLTAEGFVNPSATAIENVIAQSLGTIVDNTITEIANSEAYINQTIATQNYGKPGWYVAIALAFQYGDSLSINTSSQNIVVNGVTIGPGQYYYATPDPSALIVNQAAFVASGSGLFLKVATLNTMTNLLQALSSAQLTSFVSYFSNFEIAGLPVGIVSLSANILGFNAVATYSNSYDLGTLQTNISNALASFRDSFEFNGVLYITQLEQYLVNNVPGLISFFTSSTTIDSVPFSGSTILSSGYFNFDPNLLLIPSPDITYNGV